MTPEERAAISRGIAEAEAGTTGRIAVRVVPDVHVDAFERAKHEFEEIGLHRYRHANAALILVAPKARRFAVLGDRALHERVGDAFWNDVAEHSGAYFARGELREGILYAVGRIGAAFHDHFAEATSS